jgi:hypothetical protein
MGRRKDDEESRGKLKSCTPSKTSKNQIDSFFWLLRSYDDVSRIVRIVMYLYQLDLSTVKF